jgi:ribosomal protein S27AE
MADHMLSEADFLRDVQAFVTEKWKRNPCDRCGSFEWSTLPGNAAVLSVNGYSREIMDREVMDRRRAPPSRYEYEVEFIPVYCNNCGNTVSIFRRVFEEWLKARSRTT